MAMSDDQIRTELGALLAEGHRYKDKVLGPFVIAGGVAGLIVGALSFGLLDDTLGIWAGPSFIIAVVIGFLVLAGFGASGEFLVKQRIDGLATRFRQAFSEESGDHARALLILKSAKTKEKVEADLLKALTKEVTFDAVPKETALASKPKASGLLGGFGSKADKGPKGPSTTAHNKEPDGMIPLDPVD